MGNSERYQQIQVANKQQNPESHFNLKRRLRIEPNQIKETELGFNNGTEDDEDQEEEEEEKEEKERSNSSSSNKSSSQCARGVSTDEDLKIQINFPNEINLEDTNSPPSTASTVSEKTQINITTNNNYDSQRFDDRNHDSVTELTMTRSSALFQLITCGSSTAIKERNASTKKYLMPNMGARKSNSNSSNLHRGVLCKNINAIKMSEEDEINYMSENPRFGNPQSEEKEYVSGSIVESITEQDRVATESSLKKSSSYNEER